MALDDSQLTLSPDQNVTRLCCLLPRLGGSGTLEGGSITRAES
jgi:hypothetical protein